MTNSRPAQALISEPRIGRPTQAFFWLEWDGVYVHRNPAPPKQRTLECATRRPDLTRIT